MLIQIKNNHYINTNSIETITILSETNTADKVRVQIAFNSGLKNKYDLSIEEFSEFIEWLEKF